MSLFMFPAHELSEMVDFSAQRWPQEACGLICRRNGDENISVFQTSNVADEPEKNYLMNPIELLNIFEAGFKPFAVWHSHPQGSQRPSPQDTEVFSQEGLRDIYQMILFPEARTRGHPWDWAWSASVWLIEDGRPREVELRCTSL